MASPFPIAPVGNTTTPPPLPFNNITRGLFGNGQTSLFDTQANVVVANNIVSDVIGTEATSEEQLQAARASQITAAGDAREAEAYTSAAGVAGENATLAKVSGDIAGFQQMREVKKTLGAQRAGVAAAGFGASGSAVNLARSSLQQGYLAHQVIGTNSQLQQNGFLEQQMAAKGEADATTYASTAALALSAYQNQAGQLSKANAAALATGLSTVAPGTAQAKLAAAAAAGQPLSPTDVTTNISQEFDQTGATIGAVPPGFQSYDPHTGTQMPTGTFINPMTGVTLNTAMLNAINQPIGQPPQNAATTATTATPPLAAPPAPAPLPPPIGI